MIYWQYLFAELRRRKSRAVLTALGLGVGVGLVVIVSALSRGLDRAQAEVLEPLTGVGTDMTVTRPVNPGQNGQGLTSAEREKLQKENGPRRVGLQNLGDPGEKFTRVEFTTGANLSFAAGQLNKVVAIDGVGKAAAGLSVSQVTVSGTVPEQTSSSGGGMGGLPPGGGGPESIKFDSRSVTGVDQTSPIGPIQRDQLSDGIYFSAGTTKEAIVSASYAKQKNLSVGEALTLSDRNFKIVGIVSAPLGGSASDIYIKLTQLQKIADMQGRVNTIYVRAKNAASVSAAAAEIEQTIPSSSVTTSQTLADRVGGSVVDARKLADKLGSALVIAALASSVLVAILLTLSAVSKRTRELGTLKAIGWSRGRVVRQVAGESLAQGVLGGIAGVAIGAIGAFAVSAAGLEMKASVASSTASGGGPGGGPFAPGGPLGSLADAVVSGSRSVNVTAPLDLNLILLAVGLAICGGALAGAAGGMRAARLRPAEALRHAE
ncbi:MAG: ABC transporter permease [Actinobacteria bacterium]|nr:ABC transporter permease [Actinomycetota bacterium]